MRSDEVFAGVGKSTAMKDIICKIETISSCDVNVLVYGESGTGKELAARAIHYKSCRAGKPFVPLNCGAIPENLFENELFGHVKGAFTDAHNSQKGLVKEAEGGTLFLDEIGAISPYNQVKLLRLIQDNEYKPLGDPRIRKSDIKIIAATNDDLWESMKSGKFREDLFYRINVVFITIPPLRERIEDIPVLTKFFAKKYSREFKKPFKEFSERAMKALISFHWPGNIRELENKIQQAIVLAKNPVITIKDLQLNRYREKNNNPNEELGNFSQARKKIVGTFEKTYLEKLLSKFEGDMVRAAACAGKSRTALWNMLSRYNLHPKEFRPI